MDGNWLRGAGLDVGLVGLASLGELIPPTEWRHPEYPESFDRGLWYRIARYIDDIHGSVEAELDGAGLSSLDDLSQREDGGIRDLPTVLIASSALGGHIVSVHELQCLSDITVVLLPEVRSSPEWLLQLVNM